MEIHTSQNKTCPFCNLEVSCVSAMNRHIKNIHNQQQDSDVRQSHIICPLCTGTEIICGTYNKLEKHLEVSHKLKVEMQTQNFVTREGYEQLFDEQGIETTYAAVGTKRYNDYVEKSYTCNRSNSIGYGSKCSKRMVKAGGSIKMYEVCPSRTYKYKVLANR